MSENLSITHLRTFLWVATLGSFRKTAEKMKTTQPAISSRIAKLEEILGARLFDRDTGHIQITPEGEALRPYAEEMIKTAEKLPDIVKGDSRSSGVMHVGITGYALGTWFPKFLEQLPTVFPNVELRLTVDTSAHLKQGLITRALDVAFLTGPINNQRVENIKFATYEINWFAAPSTGLNSDTPYNLRDLNRFPMITASRLSNLYMEVTEYLKVNKVTGFNLFPCASYAFVRDLAKQGTGIGILPDSLGTSSLKDGSLVKLNCDWTPSPLRFTGSYPQGPKSHLAIRLVEFAKTLI